ncbi:MAG: zinc-ribbon domain containing protein [Bacillota bacterium]
MSFADKTLVCRDCGEEFVFTAGEQEFFAEKGLTNEPSRCRQCRRLRKSQREAQTERQMYEAVCAECGAVTEVPFKPSGRRPIYCSSCYSNYRRTAY